MENCTMYGINLSYKRHFCPLKIADAGKPQERSTANIIGIHISTRKKQPVARLQDDVREGGTSGL